MNTEIRFLLFIALTAVLLLVVAACGNRDMSVQHRCSGHYNYRHGWNYNISDGHIDVQETGTMDFYMDGTALDSARQVYVLSLNDGGRATMVFNYISPSRWRVEGEDFYFVGLAESFRMDLVEIITENCTEERASSLSDGIVESVRTGIAREIKFHLDKLTKKQLVWSYCYPDGHRDTWTFNR